MKISYLNDYTSTRLRSLSMTGRVFVLLSLIRKLISSFASRKIFIFGHRELSAVPSRIGTLILCVFFISPAFSETDEERFLKANKLYLEEKFEDSLKLYDSILDKRFEDLFNLGNNYYKLGKYLDAIAAWRKALKFSNFNEYNKVEHNLKKAYEKISKENNINFLNMIFNLIKKHILNISTIYLQMFLIIGWYLFLGFLKLIPKKFSSTFLFFLFFFNFIIIGAIGIKYYEQNKKIAFTQYVTMIHAGPDELFHTIGTLNLADEVKIVDEANKWLKISKNNLSGWVLANSLLII